MSPRWLAARLALAALHAAWALAHAPALWPAALALSALLLAALAPASQRAPIRARAWLAAHAAVLAALSLRTLAPDAPHHALQLALATAVFASATATLAGTRRALPLVPAFALAAAHLAPGPYTWPLTLALGAFAALRPLSALGELTRALGLHDAAPDPLLAWRPMIGAEATP